MEDGHASNDHSGDNRPDNHVRLPIVAAALTTLIVGVAAFLPATRLWGINHLAYYPVWIRLVALGIIAATFHPSVAHRFYAIALRVPRWLRGRSRITSTALIIVISIASTAVFWSARVSTNLLGDGQLIAQSYEAAAKGSQAPVMRKISAIVKLEPIAKGVTIVYYGASKVAREWFGKSATKGLRFVICIAGAFVILIILLAVRNGTGSPHLDTWLLFLSVFSCAIQLFFGYIEMYPPLVLFLVIYVVTAIMTLHGRASAWLPLFVFLVSFAMHVQAILFLPSLLFLVAWRSSKERRSLIERIGVPVLVGATVAGAVVGRFFTGLDGFFLPLLANDKMYGIVSPAHIVDVFNEVLMLLPILPVVLALLWVSRSRPEPELEEGEEPGLLTTKAEWQFVLIGVLSCLVYLVGFHAKIGFARDWDLFMMSAVALIPLSLLAVGRYIARCQPSEMEIARIAAPVLVLSIVVSTAWFGVNASKARTTQRFESILSYDNTRAGRAYENLAILHHDDDRLDEAVRIMELSIEASGNPRRQTRLALYYRDAGTPEKGQALLYDILERHPDFDRARKTLVLWLERTDRWDLIVLVARGGLEQSPKDSTYFFYYGESLIRAGNPREGVVWLKKALLLNPPARALAQIQKRLREFESE